MYAAGQGNRDGRGSDHFAHEGLVKRVIAGHWNMAPNLGQLAMDNKIEAYNIPQGVLCHMYRDVAAHRIGTVTHVGLHTFADPRIEGGKLNSRTTEDLVEVINIFGEERLIYKPQPIDVALIRATFADENGNISMHKEVCPCDATAMAQAARNSGGIVIVQVEKVVKAGSIDPKLVKIPGILVDAVVVSSPEEQRFFHDNTGYILLQPSAYVAISEKRSGRWCDFMGSYAPKTVEGEIVSLYIDHGREDNADYQYLILPASTAEKTAAFAVQDIRVIRNDTSIQAVAAGNCFYVTAYEPQVVNLQKDLQVDLQTPGIYMFRLHNGNWLIEAADPTHPVAQNEGEGCEDRLPSLP